MGQPRTRLRSLRAPRQGNGGVTDTTLAAGTSAATGPQNMHILIAQTTNQSGNDALCIAPLTDKLIEYLDYLVSQHAIIAKAVPGLIQFRTSQPHGLRLVHDGPLYDELQQAAAGNDVVVHKVAPGTLASLADLATALLELIVYDDRVQLLGHARRDDDEYVSASLEPPLLRQLLAHAH